MLLLPARAVGETIGRRAVVAWSGSRETARAAHDALPFLVESEDVMVAALGKSAAASVDHAVAMLARHGVRATRRVEEGADDAGRRLLAIADDLGATLLVMGAYGHTRLRELVLGGATGDVLSSAQIPLLLSS